MTDPTATATANQKLHFYQKGTFTVGNRLVPDTDVRCRLRSNDRTR